MAMRKTVRLGAALLLAGWLAAGDAAGTPQAWRSFWSTLSLESTLCLGEYVVRAWRAPDESSLGGAVTIEQAGRPLVVLGDAAVHPLTGTDIDASGWPNAVVETYTGGAHCCSATRVFDLAERLVEIDLPPSPGGNVAAGFVDLDGDGIWEVVSADDSFAYVYCAYAGSPAVPVALALDAARRRYVPASFRFPDIYRESIRRDTQRAATASAGGDLGWDGTPKCEVLPLVLDLMYSGDCGAARRALEAFYEAADRDAFWAEILTTVSASPYFVPRP